MPIRQYPTLADVSDDALPTVVSIFRGVVPEPRHGLHCVLEVAEFAAGQFYPDQTPKAAEPMSHADIANLLEAHMSGMKAAGVIPWALIIEELAKLIIQLLNR